MSLELLLPEGYSPSLDELATEKAIRKIKGQFQNNLAFELNLNRVTAPLFVLAGTGINDNLNGVEPPVSFEIPEAGGQKAEVVHSLAKWKRMKLAALGMPAGMGIYTDMNAIRSTEELDNLHSLYVDQWDWEKVVLPEWRTLDYLEHTVERIYYAIRRTEASICSDYPQLKPFLPEKVVFHFAEHLEKEFPTLTPREREDVVAKRDGAVFVIGIGGALPISGKPHDGRSPDYDDWTTPTVDGCHGLNGDIIVWNPVLKRSFEISSMGIRVTPDVLLSQLEISGQQQRKGLVFHKALLEGRLPLTMGGGIGQSRLCMLLLQKAHIGEVQCSIWPEAMRKACQEHQILLL